MFVCRRLFGRVNLTQYYKNDYTATLYNYFQHGCELLANSNATPETARNLRVQAPAPEVTFSTVDEK